MTRDEFERLIRLGILIRIDENAARAARTGAVFRMRPDLLRTPVAPGERRSVGE